MIAAFPVSNILGNSWSCSVWDVIPCPTIFPGTFNSFYSEEKTAAMEHKHSAVRNGDVAIDFPGDGNYSQRPAPHSPTLGHVQWNSFAIENQTPHEQVSHYLSLNFHFIQCSWKQISLLEF